MSGDKDLFCGRSEKQNSEKNKGEENDLISFYSCIHFTELE